MRRSVLLPTLGLLLATALACGGGEVTTTSSDGGDAPAAASSSKGLADWHPVKHCADIEVMSGCFDTMNAELSEDDCLIAVSYKAKPTDGACPAEGRIAACKTEEGMQHYYKTGERSYDMDQAKDWCATIQEGTFIKL